MELEIAQTMGLVGAPGAAPSVLQAALDALRQRAAVRDQPSGERSALRQSCTIASWASSSARPGATPPRSR